MVTPETADSFKLFRIPDDTWQPVPDTLVSATATTEAYQATTEATAAYIYCRVRVTVAP